MVDIQAAVIDYGFWGAVAIVVIGILIFSVMKIRDRFIYVFKHETTRLRKDGRYKKLKGKAGFITRRDGIKYFRIKMGRMPWQKMDLVQHPNLEEMDGDNTVYYIQLGPDILVQARKELITKIKYSDYVRDKKGELVPLTDKDGEPVYMRNRKGELMYEIVTETDKNHKIIEVKRPIPVHIPIPEDYEIVEEITPIQNVDKAYTTAELAAAKRAIEGEASWKVTAAFVVGAIMIIVITVLSYYFLFGGGGTK